MRAIIRTKGFLPHQLEWWNLPNFMKLLVGGFGCGKTYIGALRSIYLSYLHRPHPGMYVSPTYQLGKRTIIISLNEIINRTGLDVSYNKTESEFIFHDWGGRFWVASGDNPDSLRGPNLAWAAIDEPFIQDKMVLDILLSRIRVGNPADRELFLTGTPESLNWGYSLALNEEGKNDIGYVVGKTVDNHHLGEDVFKRLWDAYTPEMREAWLEGKFINMTLGRAYKPFDRARHIKHSDMQGEICAGIDFNVDYMTAEIFINGNGYVHFFDEIRKSHSNTFELAEALRLKYPGIKVYPDPTGSGRRSSATKTDHQILSDAGFHVLYRKQVPVMDRVNAVNSMLIQDRLTIEPDKCIHLVKDFDRVVFKNGDLDKTSEMELTHASDAGGYPIEYLYSYIKRTIEQIKV